MWENAIQRIEIQGGSWSGMFYFYDPEIDKRNWEPLRRRFWGHRDRFEAPVLSRLLFLRWLMKTGRLHE